MYSKKVEEEANRRVEASVNVMRPSMEKIMERTRELLSRERNLKQRENRLKKIASEVLELRQELKKKGKDNVSFKRDLSAHKTVLRRFKARSIEAQRTISKLKRLTDENARDEVIERYKQKILSRDAQIRYLRNRIKELEAFGSLLGVDNEEEDESKQREGAEEEAKTVEDEEGKKPPSRKDILEELDVSLTDDSLTPEERRQILAEALQRSAHSERARCRKIFENVRARSAQKTVAEGKDDEEEEEEEEDVVSSILRRLDRSVRTHRSWLEDFDKEFRAGSKQDEEEVEDSLERARALEITQMEMVRELRDYINDEKEKKREEKKELEEEKRKREEEESIWKERSEKFEMALRNEKERVQERLAMTMERLERIKERSSYY